MTDRINSLMVVLDVDYREDDIKPLIDAIGCFRGVVSVRKNVSDFNSVMAEDRAREKLTNKIWKVLEEKK